MKSDTVLLEDMVNVFCPLSLLTSFGVNCPTSCSYNFITFSWLGWETDFTSISKGLAHSKPHFLETALEHRAYLQVQRVVSVRRLFLRAGPLHCCCTGWNPPTPGSWREAAASCSSTNLQQEHRGNAQLRYQTNTLQVAHNAAWWGVAHTCAIPVRKIVRSFRALLPVVQGIQRQKLQFLGGIFRSHYDGNQKYLFFQWQAPTIVRMRAVRAMTNTGTRTAARAMSKHRDNQYQAINVWVQSSDRRVSNLCWCEEASWCF